MRSLLLIPLLCACDGTADVLDAFFVDEVVGAPARSSEVTFLEGASCADLFTVPADEIDQVGSVIARRTAGYPIHPDDEVFKEIPRGRPLLIHVVARDETGLMIGRGCLPEELPASGPLSVSVELRALPQCETDWRFLDITLVIDTTFRMALVYSANEHIDALKSFADSFEQGTRFSIITHGHTQPPAEHLPPTTDRQEVAAALEALRGLSGGEVELFNSIITAARLSRSRAVCPRRPAILSLEAGRDAVQSNIPVTESKIGLFATVGDPSDDIYVHGVFATAEAKSDLEELIEGLTLASLSSGATASVLQEALLTARFAFDGLIVR